MRRDVRTVRADTTLAAFRRAVPAGLGAPGRRARRAERYAGIVLLAEAHGPELDERRAATRVDAAALPRPCWCRR